MLSSPVLHEDWIDPERSGAGKKSGWQVWSTWTSRGGFYRQDKGCIYNELISYGKIAIIHVIHHFIRMGFHVFSWLTII